MRDSSVRLGRALLGCRPARRARKSFSLFYIAGGERPVVNLRRLWFPIKLYDFGPVVPIISNSVSGHFSN